MKTITYAEAKRLFNEMLDASNREIKIGTLRYDPSYVLRACDATAYYQGVLDFLDSEDLELE